MKRVIIIVLDSVGVGAMPDAEKYGDAGADTLGNVAKAVGGLSLPHLKEMGLGNIHKISGIDPVNSPLACYGRMAEASCGKDTTTGHWELMGLVLKRSFPVYPEGFPPEVIEKFEKAVGRKILGNCPASGTEIIKELGEKHMQTGCPIVYTSADSVFQIAAHEVIIPVEELYDMCTKAREILTGEHSVARVIARPFIGKPGSFSRTERRRDFSVVPFKKTLLDYLKENGYSVYSVGKIEDIFAHRGITQSNHTHSNMDALTATLKLIKKNFSGIIFTNLVDFDMLYGHRNDVQGYKDCLIEADKFLPKILKVLNKDDLLIITADHGCDPTYHTTDHTREYVPLLVYGEDIKSGVNLGVRTSFADIAATVEDIFNIKNADLEGASFWDDIKIEED
ncbi:MAG: phosphopentomutase [Armatimonadota bacterium]